LGRGFHGNHALDCCGIRKANKAPRYLFGFQLFDKVLYEGQECFVFGRRTSGYFDLRKLDGAKVSPSINWRKLKLMRKEGKRLPPRDEFRGFRRVGFMMSISAREIVEKSVDRYHIEQIVTACTGILYMLLLYRPATAEALAMSFLIVGSVALSIVALRAARQSIALAALASAILCAIGWGICSLYQVYIEQTGQFAFLAQGMAKGLGIVGLFVAAAVTLGVGYSAHKKDNKGWKLNTIHIPLPATQTEKSLDLELCRSEHGKPVYLKGKDRFTHQLIIGTTGTGKTTTVLFSQIFQDLRRKYEGEQLGITVIEPSGALVRKVAEWCDKMQMPYVLIDLENPERHFNPLEGPADVVAETTRTVLRATFGEQEAFFAQAQELHAKNTILLLKGIKGDNLDFRDLAKALFSESELHWVLDEYKRRYGTDTIVEYFEHEAFGKQQDKLRQFAMGLRLQVSDLLTNPNINYVLSGKSDVNIDTHLEQGGILLVNTAGGIGRLSDVFGMFMIMHLQAGVFRRSGTEGTRIPHILYVDEIGQYLNPEFSRLLSFARQFRCACTFAIQGPSQLELPRRKAFKDIIFSMCRSKIVFGGLEAEDAKVVSEMMGEEIQPEITSVRDRWHPWPKSYREAEKEVARFSPTDIMEMGMWQVVVKRVIDGYNQPPVLGYVKPPWELAKEIDKYLNQIPRHRIKQH